MMIVNNGLLLWATMYVGLLCDALYIN